MRFLLDQGNFILHYLLISHLVILGTSFYCDKAFTYYEEYGQNSFNVTCSGITEQTTYILENITINNEISLTIVNSTLKNASSTLFRNVRNIRILNIINTHISFNKDLPIFKTLNQLESLVIRNSSFVIGKSTFYGVQLLKNLEFTNNNVTLVFKGCFSHLENLEKLDISQNNIKSLRDIPLCGLKKLRFLNLAQNSLRILEQFYFVCDDAKNIPSLEENFTIKPNSYTSFYDKNWPAYGMMELNLSHNQIITTGESLKDFRKLRILDLSYNNISRISNDHFQSLSGLEKLNLKNNKLQHVDDRIFANKLELRSIDFSYNKLNAINIVNCSKLQSIHLENNNLVAFLFENLPNLKDLHVEYNNLSELFSYDFVNLPQLHNLFLTGNKLRLTPGLFKNLNSVKYLDLSNNSIQNIPDNVFRGLSNLRCLDLSNNHLAYLNESTFKDLESLEILNISSNYLQSLSYISLESLKNLKILDIAVNKLKFIEYDLILSKLPELNNINIKYNFLTCDNLSKLIIFLKNRHIGYTHNEYVDLEKINQNIAGIPCRSTNLNLIAVKRNSSGSLLLFNFGIAIVILLLILITSTTSYKFYIYLKRRKYRADEFELVDE